MLSILLEEIKKLPDGGRLCKAAFLVPDLVEPYVRVGADIEITEGPTKIVANAKVCEVFEEAFNGAAGSE